MSNIKKFSLVLFLVGFLLIGLNVTKASASDVNITIRDAEEIIYSGLTPLPEEGTTEIQGHSVNSRSVLGVLNLADQNSSDFAITDLTYYDSFGSFYLKCINDKCDDWQYVVNNETPSQAIDQNILTGGEEIYFYFGQPHKLSLSENEINTTETLIVTTEEYNWDDNSWQALGGVTVGLTQPDPNNPFSPIEVLTSEVDDSGQASFTNIAVGTYDVGIKEDFYFPTEALTVVEAPDNGGNNGGGSGSSGSYIRKEDEALKSVFNIEKAFNFLISQQLENGSFGEDLYTDWVSLALATTEKYEEQKLKLIKYQTEKKLVNPFLTDYERHALALMALGINPYLDENPAVDRTSYIQKIVASFDGKQFGDPIEDNDDIFALIVLQNTGYTKNDKMITDAVDFVLSKQKENGSWDNSVDMTGIAIQVIAKFTEKNSLLQGVSQTDKPRDSALLVSGDSDLGKDKFSSMVNKAKEFLKQNQKEDGGFGNVSSTAWAIEGIITLGENPTDWIKNENTPFDYLAINQDTDGGIKGEILDNRIWETAYTLTAFSGKSWNQIMQKFKTPLLQSDEVKTLITKPEIKIKELETKKRAIQTNLIKEITASSVNAIEQKENNTPETPEKGFKNFFRKIIGFFF